MTEEPDRHLLPTQTRLLFIFNPRDRLCGLFEEVYVVFNMYIFTSINCSLYNYFVHEN
ncbi:hypothetical protein CDL12_03363 [Handroanthus impetiginosus]|uniref:Uncharacterized protein n=1 Tax=Handroanthus impetiginosus TaxID=429701 RepID=A0A2G9I2D0_9LAMI|nr:hypothetical protein CDL12_03363 [Handroanthus impetiginosus]